MLTTDGAACCTAPAYVVRRAGGVALSAGGARSAGAAGGAGRLATRIRSGRSAMIRKARASPPTTDPVTKISTPPKRLSVIATPVGPGTGCSVVYNAPPPARYETRSARSALRGERQRARERLDGGSRTRRRR